MQKKTCKFISFINYLFLTSYQNSLLKKKLKKNEKKVVKSGDLW